MSNIEEYYKSASVSKSCDIMVMNGLSQEQMQIPEGANIFYS